MGKKVLFSVVVVILALSSLVFAFVALPPGGIAGTVNDNGTFVLPAPYKLDRQGFLEINGIQGLLQYRSAVDPNALCMGPNFVWGQAYDIVSMRGWPLSYWYETGICGPPTQVLFIPLVLDLLFLVFVYSLVLTVIFKLVYRVEENKKKFEVRPLPAISVLMLLHYV